MLQNCAWIGSRNKSHYAKHGKVCYPVRHLRADTLPSVQHDCQRNDNGNDIVVAIIARSYNPHGGQFTRRCRDEMNFLAFFITEIMESAARAF